MTEEPQNVLVMFCDQLRADLPGYAGGPVRTPNLDALAGDALVFDNAYTPTAICSPARASLMTGLYPHGHHMYNNSTPRYSYCHHLPPEVTMLQDWIDSHTNCRTGYFGKWHIGPSGDLFKSTFHRTHPRAGLEGGGPLFAAGHGHPNTKLGEVVETRGNPRMPLGQRTGTLDVPMRDFPDVQAARYTREFIQERDSQTPFCAVCSFPGPHSPWLIPHEFGVRYVPEGIALWQNRDDPLNGKPLNQQKLQRIADARAGNPDAAVRDENMRQKLAVCFSYVELIDECVGEVIRDLKAAGLYEQTAIIFTADHGDMAGAHGFHSKGSYMYDEIYRIPMLYKPAGRTIPGRITEPVHLMDVTATCVDVLGGGERADMNGQPLHGMSLNRLTRDDPDWPRSVHYAEYHGDWYGHYSARMVTDGRWKLVWNFSDLCELYDTAEDPNELNNRFYDPDCREIRSQLFAQLHEPAERYEDGQALKFLREIDDIGDFEDAIGGQYHA